MTSPARLECSTVCRGAKARLGRLAIVAGVIGNFAACSPMIHLGDESDLTEAGFDDGGVSSSDVKPGSDVTPRTDSAGVRDAAATEESIDARATLIWTATFETGDFSELTTDGQGFVLPSTNSVHVASTEQAHGGSYSSKLTISTGSTPVEYVYLYRGVSGAPTWPEAYYGAWFYVPQAYSEHFYWNIFHFLQSASPDRGATSPIWDVNLRSNDAGELIPYVWDFIHSTERDPTPPVAVSPGSWVHFEVLLRAATTPNGRFAVWQDGVLVIDLQDVATTSMPWIQWGVGTNSTDIMPTPASLYIDDVTLSLARLGP